jgi:hypothetical protein
LGREKVAIALLIADCPLGKKVGGEKKGKKGQKYSE